MSAEELEEENRHLKDQLATLSKTHAKDRQRLDELLSDHIRDKRIIGEALGLVGEDAMIHMFQLRKIQILRGLENASERIELLRKALAGVIGAETKEELEGMVKVMKIMPTPHADMVVGINAIEALLSELKINEQTN